MAPNAEATDLRSRSPDSESSAAARLFYGIAIPGCAGLLLLHAVGIATATGPATAIAALLAFASGVATADLVTGIVHWACDTWGDSDTRWLGPGLIHFFREHHRKPSQMLRHDFLDVNGGAAGAAFVVLGGITALAGAQPGAEPRALEIGARSFLLGLVGTSAFANQLHYWAHVRKPPGAVRVLQRYGLVLSRAAHARHHRAPHTRGYCISTGWLNRPLDAIHFWRGLENGVRRLTGAQPRAGGPALSRARVFDADDTAMGEVGGALAGRWRRRRE